MLLDRGIHPLRIAEGFEMASKVAVEVGRPLSCCLSCHFALKRANQTTQLCVHSMVDLQAMFVKWIFLHISSLTMKHIVSEAWPHVQRSFFTSLWLTVDDDTNTCLHKGSEATLRRRALKSRGAARF